MEIWLKIDGYDYDASNYGEIRNSKTKRVIKQRVNKRNGYKFIDLQVNKERKTLKVHKLIALTFLGPSNGLQVDHINRVRDDNRVDNLRWVTQAENNKNRDYRVSENQISEIIRYYNENKTINEIYNLLNRY